MPENPEPRDDLAPARRTVLRGVAVAAAAGVPLLASPTAAAAKPKPPKKEKGKAKPVGSTKDVPVGSGKYFEKESLIVTQPKKGEFKAFNAICTHANCPVSNFETKGEMVCDCHNGVFSLEGEPVRGPVRRPMKPEKITVKGGKIFKAD